MYIFKEDESVVDIRSVNMMVCKKCAINGANVYVDTLCQTSTRPTDVHIQIFYHLEMDEWKTIGLLVWGFKTILNESMEYSYVLSIRILKSKEVITQVTCLFIATILSGVLKLAVCRS